MSARDHCASATSTSTTSSTHTITSPSLSSGGSTSKDTNNIQFPIRKSVSYKLINKIGLNNNNHNNKEFLSQRENLDKANTDTEFEEDEDDIEIKRFISDELDEEDQQLHVNLCPFILYLFFYKQISLVLSLLLTK